MHSTVRLVDRIEGMRADLADGWVDVVVTSPPDHIGNAYTTYLDQRSEADYPAWTQEWTHQVARVLRPDGSFFLKVGASPRQPLLERFNTNFMNTQMVIDPQIAQINTDYLGKFPEFQIRPDILLDWYK